MPNDCITKFCFQCPETGVDIGASFDHMSGCLDLVINDCRDNVDDEQWAGTLAFCDEHENNYFYIRYVYIALKCAGVDVDNIVEH